MTFRALTLAVALSLAAALHATAAPASALSPATATSAQASVIEAGFERGQRGIRRGLHGHRFGGRRFGPSRRFGHRLNGHRGKLIVPQGRIFKHRGRVGRPVILIR